MLRRMRIRSTPSLTTCPTTRTQLQVRASPLETFVALMGAPRNSQTAVVSGTLTVQSLDDHSDVVRLCLRPAWLKLAWASPRDFCLARWDGWVYCWANERRREGRTRSRLFGYC